MAKPPVTLEVTGGRSDFLTKILIAAACIGVLLCCWSFISSNNHAPVRLFAPSTSISNATCSVTFQKYVSSELEQRWLDNMATWQNDFCTAWNQEADSLRALMTVIKAVREGTPTDNVETLSKTMSRYEYKVVCDGAVSTRHSWIEPLVAGLRHPLALCGFNGTDKYLLDRNYIVLETARDLPNGAMGQKLYFDLGASMYSEGPGGASQQYFVEEYARRGIVFDRMWLWEPKPSANVFQKGFNSDIAYKYHYFTTFADPTPNSGFNPYTIMKKVGSPRDFIMFKLDIDTADVEKQFVKQLFDDPQLISLVDEFYFEHHVDFKPMLGYWGQATDKGVTMKESYDMFLQLRKLGIRAHSWP